MSDDAKNDTFSRRGFLGMGSAALAAAGILAEDVAAQERAPYPTKGENLPTKDVRSASAPVPAIPRSTQQNPDSFLPPPTDAGGVQTFKYPFGSPQTDAGGRMVARSYGARAARFEVDCRRGHAIDRGRHPRTALAHRRGVGLHALRKRAHHRA